MKFNKKHVIIFAIFVLSFVIRILFSNQIGLYTDEVNIVVCKPQFNSENFLGGKMYAWSFLGPYLVQLFFVIENQIGARMFNLICGMLTLLILYLIGRKILKNAGIFVLFFGAFSSMLIYVSATIRFEGPMILFLLLGFYFILKSFEDTKNYLFTSILFIISFLFKYLAVIPIITTLVFYFITKPKERKFLFLVSLFVFSFIFLYFMLQFEHLKVLFLTTQILHTGKNYLQNFEISILTMSPFFVLVPLSYFRKKMSSEIHNFLVLCSLNVLVMILFFTFMGSEHPFFLPIYLSMAFPFLSLIAGIILALTKCKKIYSYFVMIVICSIMIQNIFLFSSIPLGREWYYAYPNWKPAAEWLKNQENYTKLIATHPAALWFYLSGHPRMMKGGIDCKDDMNIIETQNSKIIFSHIITDQNLYQFDYIITFRPTIPCASWTLLDSAVINENFHKFLLVYSYTDGPYNVSILKIKG